MANKIGQEEMVGFAMIIILVAVIILVFIGISMSKNKSQNIESYEAENFIQAMLQYTTQCQDSSGYYLPVKELIFSCITGSPGINCPNGADSCLALNSTLKGIMNQSWNINEGSPIKGYQLNVTSSTGKMPTSIVKGSTTSNSRGASQDLPNGALSVDIVVRVYS